MSRTADHVEAFNQAVVSGDWDTFAGRFAEDATMSFVGQGRAAARPGVGQGVGTWDRK